MTSLPLSIFLGFCLFADIDAIRLEERVAGVTTLVFCTLAFCFVVCVTTGLSFGSSFSFKLPLELWLSMIFYCVFVSLFKLRLSILEGVIVFLSIVAVVDTIVVVSFAPIFVDTVSMASPASVLAVSFENL
jgi:hypothetical protein